MHKYILIPDSFKGTLSARDFCAVAREAIGRADPGAQVLSIPLADGGEGRLDSQSLGGKAVIGVARRARELGVPCAALAGAVDVSVLPRAYELGLTAAFPINPLPLPFEQVRVSCRENLSAAVENLIRFYCSAAR